VGVYGTEGMSEKINLYERLETGMDRCRICGKTLYSFGKGYYGIISHARKHVREGKAKELHLQSKRCYAGYDVVFVLVEEA